jgi:transcriptional regulator with XRE-family HTH domain
MERRREMKFDEIQAQTDVERIILIRKRYNLKQYEFSKILGYTPNHLANVENYKHPVSAKLKRKIEEFLIEQEKKETTK